MKQLKNIIISTAGALVALFSLAIPLMTPSLAQAQMDSGGEMSYCFTTNLGEGHPINPAAASALANILVSQGLWTSGTPITTFDDAVASAISGFQEKYAAEILTPNGLSYGTGYIGASTRAELNSLEGGCTPTTTPTGPVQCPAGYTCTPINQNPAPVCPAGWTCTPTTPTQPTNPTNPIQPTNPPQPNSQISSSLPLGYVETLNNSQNPPTAPGLIWVAWETLGPGYTYTVSANPPYPGSVETGTAVSQVIGINGMNMGCWGGNTVCYNGGGPFPTNGPYTFTVTATSPSGVTTNVGTSNPAYVTPTGTTPSTSGNQPPVISGVTAPTTLSVGQTGTWTVNASDPQNGSLSYNINWGDNSPMPLPLGFQTATFTHSYATAGVYTVTVTVTDSAGLTAQTTATVNVGGSTQGNSAATVSLDPSSPLASNVAVTNTTQGTYLGLPVLTFDINAQGGNLHLHSLLVDIVGGGSGSVFDAYLYQGSTQIESAQVINSVAAFNNIPDGTAGASIPINTTAPYTVKVDVAGLTASGAKETVGTEIPVGPGFVVYNSQDVPVTITGPVLANGMADSAIEGNTQTVFGQGPVFSLAGTPTISKVTTATGYKYTATFNVNVAAVGESVNLALPNSTTIYPAFGNSVDASNVVETYVNGNPVITRGIVASYSQPTGTTLSSDGTYFTIGQNQTVTIPVTYTFNVTGPSANVYALQLNGVYSFVGTAPATRTSFMAGQTAWRTPSI